MTKLLNVDEGISLHNRLLELKKDIGLRFLEVGRILYRLKEEDLYKVINPDMSWEAYCAMPDVSISPSHARNLMRIYSVFIGTLGVAKEELAGIDQRKLTAILPKVDSQNCEDLLSEARELSRSDLQKKMREDSAGEHEHRWSLITYERCDDCYEERNRTKTRVE